jgi:L-fuconolactonase
MRVDAHQHFWTLARGDYGWLTPALAPIYRDFAPADLAPQLAAAHVDATVLVQTAATVAETDFMLSLADEHAFIAGVVGWIDFEDPPHHRHLERLAHHPKFKGVRPLIQDIPDVDWMLRADLDWAFRALVEMDLTFDALGFPRHLDNFLTLIRRYPDLRVVVDHCMKPDVAHDGIGIWADGLARIARDTGAFCKLSGLATEDGPDWSTDRLAPYAAHVLDVFGPQRVMWGSDWPVLELRGSYADWLGAAETIVSRHVGSRQDVDAIFGGTAQRFYRL